MIIAVMKKIKNKYLIFITYILLYKKIDINLNT